MMNKQEIIISNEKLGIKTVFFNEDNGILGYTEKGIIYLNEFYNDNLELTNKHELLHLFEDSKQFLGTKKIIFSLLGEKELNRLRTEYYLKYGGLYSEEEINDGILDNEIIIDIIIGNGVFPLLINDYMPNAYESIIEQKDTITLTADGRKYLSLNPSRNMANRYSGLSTWDLLFVNSYYEGKEKPKGKDRYDRIYMDAVRELDHLLYGIYYPDICISCDNNPYLERRLQEVINTYKAKGDYENANKLEENKKEALINLSNEFSNSLYHQYIALHHLLRESKYEDSFKYLILKEALTKTYRYEHGNRVVDRREMGKTIIPFMLINEFILKEIHDNIGKYQNFTDLYFDALDKYNREFLKSRNVSLNQSDKGYWIKFDKGESGTSKFTKDSQDLGNLIRDTPWCTRKYPDRQLEEGDFYVFVDNYGRPRIAVQLRGNSISEVRGIKGGSDQELEDEYRQVAINFLNDNISVSGSIGWLKKEERNQRLSEYLVKIRTGTLSEEDLKNLIVDLDVRETMVHGDINSNERAIIKEIIKSKELRETIFDHSSDAKRVVKLIDEIEINNRILEYINKIEEGTLKEEDCVYLYDDLLYEFDKYKYSKNQKELIKTVNSTNNAFKEMMAQKFGCEPKEIYIGRLEKENIPFENGVCPLKIIIGDVSLIHCKNIDLSNLEFVKGKMEMTWSNNVNLSSLVQVEGDVNFCDCENCDVCSLEYINGNLELFSFRNSPMSSIRKITGNAKFGFLSGDKEYHNLEEVLGDLEISHQTEKMDKLRVVGGRLILDKYCEITDLPSLEVCGNLDNVPYEIESKFRYNEDKGCYVRSKGKVV